MSDGFFPFPRKTLYAPHVVARAAQRRNQFEGGTRGWCPLRTSGIEWGGASWKLFLLSLCIGGLAICCSGQEMEPIRFVDSRLTNGLRVIVSEDHFAPVYTLALGYGVGSRDEPPGRSGFAHLLEHLMFKGSKAVGTGEHSYLILNNGGTMNATTNTYRTIYFETLPKNQLALGLFLEADRMRSLAITQENLDNQRSAVEEERRLTLDNRAYGKSGEKIGEIVFDSFASQHPVIGSIKDLNVASVSIIKEFFRTYYGPNNAVLSLVGDLNTRDALVKVKKYFNDIPSQPLASRVVVSESERYAERREVVEDHLARLPQLAIAYRVQPVAQDDLVALGILSTILGYGESSRLYKRLIIDQDMVTSVFSSLDVRVGASLLQISAILRQGKSPVEVESVIDQELANLLSEPVAAKELLRARNIARRSMAQLHESTLLRAIRLADDALLYDDPARINTVLRKQLGVSDLDVKRVARIYLRKANRAVLYTSPANSRPDASQTGSPN